MKMLKIRVLVQVSLVLCVLFVCSVGINMVLAESHSDAVSHAEHEQLRAMLEVNDAAQGAKLDVLQQRLLDDEKQILRNTALVDELTASYYRIEGIGISFTLALSIVQYLLFRAHHERKKKEEEGS